MKQTKATKVMALMLSMVMITSVFVGNTLSRYVTSVSSTDSARVAVWGINAGEDTVMNLFGEDYIVAGKTIAASNVNGEKIMAPGTFGEAEFEIINFEQNVAPEVAYEVKISLDDSEIHEKIKNNPSVQWKLDNGAFGTWDQLKTSILSLSGNAAGRHVYGPGEFATAFQGTQEHKIAWQWIMDNSNNVMDTEMGNLALTNDLNAVIKVSITAQQIDDLVTNANMLDGMNQVINVNDLQPAVFRSAAPSSELQEVKVNGTTVNPSNYDVEEGSTIITLHKDYLETLGTGRHTIDIVSASMTASTVFSIEEAPVVHNGIIPEGGVYYVGVLNGSTGNYIGITQTLTAGQAFPVEVNTGDVYVYGDYEYRYGMYYNGSVWEEGSLNGWGVRVRDTSKSEYGVILTSINGKDILNVDSTFMNCTSLVNAPAIPDNVIYMDSTFMNCTSLVNAPVIPENVSDMNYTFASCGSLINAPIIPDTVITMNSTFKGCKSLVNAPVIPNNVFNIDNLFINCENLTGVIEINTDPVFYNNVLKNTVKPITLTGSSIMLDEILATSNNGNVMVME